MGVPIEFLRGVLGLLCILFAHMLGRSAAAAHAGRQKPSRAYAWALRCVVCGAALAFRHRLDAVVAGIYVLALLGAAAGFWLAQRAKPEEDLSVKIFSDENQ